MKDPVFSQDTESTVGARLVSRCLFSPQGNENMGPLKDSVKLRSVRILMLSNVESQHE